MPLSNSLDSSLTIIDIYPQAHGAFIVAFHPEVFRVSLFIFSQRRTRYNVSSMGMNKITYLHSEPIVYDKGKNHNSRIVDTHLGQPQG